MSDPSTFYRLAAMVALLTRKAAVGRTALNQLLWFADAAHVLKFGRTISGSTYARWPSGPLPADIDTVRRVLIKRHLIVEQITESARHRSYAYQATARNIDFKVLRQEFRKSERKIIKAVTRSLGGQPARYLLERSHSFESWIRTSPGEDIDFTLVRSDEKLRRWLIEKEIL